MITETMAARAVPPDGWLRKYVKWAARQTTSPLAYHVACGLNVLGVSTPLSYGHHYAGTIYGNLYSLLIGRSGEDQKSTALNLSRKIIWEVDDQLLGSKPASTEGLIDELSARPRQIIHYPEFGSFLAKAQRKGGYFEPMKALLTDLWDCTPQSRVKAGNNIIRADNPRLSIVAACSFPYLEAHTEAHDLSGGFLGRWAVIVAQRERTNPNPTGDLNGFAELVEGIRARATMEEAGACLGLTDSAYKRWCEWFYEIEKRKLPSIISGTRTRAPSIARKVALIHAWDWGEPLAGNPWKLTDAHIEYGIRFAELHLASVITLGERLAEHPDARVRRQVLNTVPLGGLKSLGQIMLKTKLRKRTVMEILDGLVIDGSLTPHEVQGVGAGTLYARPDVPAEVA